MALPFRGFFNSTTTDPHVFDHPSGGVASWVLRILHAGVQMFGFKADGTFQVKTVPALAVDGSSNIQVGYNGNYGWVLRLNTAGGLVGPATTLEIGHLNQATAAYQLAPVSLGAADSGGAGYRLLRVPN